MCSAKAKCSNTLGVNANSIYLVLFFLVTVRTIIKSPGKMRDKLCCYRFSDGKRLHILFRQSSSKLDKSLIIIVKVRKGRDVRGRKKSKDGNVCGWFIHKGNSTWRVGWVKQIDMNEWRLERRWAIKENFCAWAYFCGTTTIILLLRPFNGNSAGDCKYVPQ